MKIRSSVAALVVLGAGGFAACSSSGEFGGEGLDGGTPATAPSSAGTTDGSSSLPSIDAGGPVGDAAMLPGAGDAGDAGDVGDVGDGATPIGDGAPAPDAARPVDAAPPPDANPPTNYDGQLRPLIAAHGITGSPARPFAAPSAPMVELGRMLFFDKIMSGPKDTACASCHVARFHGSDSLRTSAGVGGNGVGAARLKAGGELGPRRTPTVVNAAFLTSSFWEGRVSQVDPRDVSKGFLCPEQEVRHDGSSMIGEQPIFPLVTAQEMRGNFFAGAADDSVRIQIAARVAAIPGYEAPFVAAFGDKSVTFTRMGAAIGAFESTLVAVDTPWFRYVKGNPAAVTDDAKRGAILFYGKAGCVSCHSGDLGTDLGFHAIGVPQFGYGKGDGPDGHDDFGRGRFDHLPADNYKFRTPPLVNVALHGPYGHDGAFQDLEDMVRHHLDPKASLAAYATGHDKGRLPSVYVSTLRPIAPLIAQLDPKVAAGTPLTEPEIKDLMAYLTAQSADDEASALAFPIPTSVPSGLSIDK